MVYLQTDPKLIQIKRADKRIHEGAGAVIPKFPRKEKNNYGKQGRETTF